MDLSPQGAQFVRLHEGFVPRWYADPVGVGTIGIGFTWRSAAFRVWWGVHKPGIKFGPGATMTRAEAEDALIYLFAEEYGKAVNQFLGRTVRQHVFDGMASPVYNLGPGSLEWKWAKAAKAGDYPGAAALLRTTGVTAKGKKLSGLVRRRKEEAELLEHGIYTGVGSARPKETADAMADGMLVRGEAGPAVAALIRDLAFLGFYDGAQDDAFGYGTEAAIMAFQAAHGLKQDGYAGPKTLAAISAARNPQSPPALPIEPGTVHHVDKDGNVKPGKAPPQPNRDGLLWRLLFALMGLIWKSKEK